MDPNNQTQSQLETNGQPNVEYAGYPVQEHVPNTIEPCATIIIDSTASPGPFHLLSCGHIIAIDEADQRCGRNCQHAVSDSSTPRPASASLPAVRETLPDTLYCEICTGIPFENYSIMHPFDNPLSPFPNPPERPRRCFALTRSLLQSAFDLDDEQVVKLLCPLLFGLPNLFGWESVHKLRCGHVVWCAPTRPCASNCATGEHGAVCRFQTFLCDAILCQECAARAELVYARFAASGRATREREEMSGEREEMWLSA